MRGEPQIFGRDLISYHNDGKGCTAITRKVESMSEYSSPCIDMRADEALISGMSARPVESLTGPAPALRHGVARNRRISVEDSQMRHGRKSRSVLFDGYKRHVLRDLDSCLEPAVGITPANVPEAAVTDDQLAA
jgi:hypothetical protein